MEKSAVLCAWRVSVTIRVVTSLADTTQSFAQLSDPHLTSLEVVRARDLLNKRALGYLSWRHKRRFEHRPYVLEALQQDLANTDLAQVLVTGDLTHIGLPAEFQQATEWLDQLGSPEQVALVPGNHDACVRADHGATFELWREYMRSDEAQSTAAIASATGEPASDATDALFPSIRVRGDIAFIGLTTGLPTPPLFATGTVGAPQLSQLPNLLCAARDRGLFRVLYLHHCPLAGAEKWRKRLTDAHELENILAAHGVELVVHGHGHRQHVGELSTSCGVAPVIAVPSASALGLHGADVAQYNRYRVIRKSGGWQLQVNARHYDKPTETFVAGNSTSYTIER